MYMYIQFFFVSPHKYVFALQIIGRVVTDLSNKLIESLPTKTTVYLNFVDIVDSMVELDWLMASAG